jgi:hypothetical protein
MLPSISISVKSIGKVDATTIFILTIRTIGGSFLHRHPQMFIFNLFNKFFFFFISKGPVERQCPVGLSQSSPQGNSVVVTVSLTIVQQGKAVACSIIILNILDSSDADQQVLA